MGKVAGSRRASTSTSARGAGGRRAAGAEPQMTEKPTASTMPPPSGSRPVETAPRVQFTPELRELQEVVAELGAIAQDNTVETDDPRVACERAAQLTGEALWWIRKVAEVAATTGEPAATSKATRRAYAEEAAIGTYDPWPALDELDQASTASLLVQCVAPVFGDELLADGLDQLAAEMIILANAVLNDEINTSSDIVHRVVYGYEHRVRVLAAIARKTLRAVGRAA